MQNRANEGKIMNKDVEKILISTQEIEDIVSRLAGEISNDFKDEEVIVVSILKGSLIFTSDLIRKMTCPVILDMMQASSYGSGTKSSGNVHIKQDVSSDVYEKNVLIVEDIIDSGNTLAKIKDFFISRKAKTVKICAMLDKPSRRVVDIKVDYVGKQVPDEFIIGYGLDYCEKYRELPYIGVLKPSVYNK